MADIGALALSLTVDPTTFEKGLMSAMSSGQKFAKGLQNVGANINQTLSAIEADPIVAAFVAVAWAAEKLYQVGTFAVTNLMEMNKEGQAAAASQSALARRFGLSADEAAGLGLEFKRLGIDQGEATGALTAFQVHLDKAAQGNTEAAATFARLHLDAKQLEKLSVAQQLEAIGDALNGLPAGGERTAAMMAVMTRRGAALLPVIQAGSKGLEDAIGKAQRWQLVISDADKAALKSAQLAEADAEIAVNSIRQSFANGVASAFAPLRQAWADLQVSFVEAAQPYLQPLREGIGNVATFFKGFIGGVKQGFADWAGPLNWIKDIFDSLWTQLKSMLGVTGSWADAGRAVGRALAWLVSGDIVIYGTLIAAQVKIWMTELEAIIAVGRAIKEHIGTALDVLATWYTPVVYGFSLVWEMGQDVWEGLKDLWNSSADDLEGRFGPIVGWLVKGWNVIRDSVQSVATALVDALGGAFDWIKGKFQEFMDLMGHLPGRIGATFRRAAEDTRKITDSIRHPFSSLGDFQAPGLPSAAEISKRLDDDTDVAGKHKAEGPKALAAGSREALETINRTIGNPDVDTGRQHLAEARKNGVTLDRIEKLFERMINKANPMPQAVAL